MSMIDTSGLMSFYERLRIFVRKLEAALFPSRHWAQRLARKYLFDRLQGQPSPLENFIETPQTKACRAKLSQGDQDKILLVGGRGSGKTVIGLQIHRCYSIPDKQIKKTKVPVFIRLRGFNDYENAYSFFVDEISKNVKTGRSWLSRIASQSWLRSGSLLLILDDLDYLDARRFSKLEQFINDYNRHSFLCISSFKPKSNFWNQFDHVELTEWRTAEAETFIYQRLKDRVDADNLVTHLRQMRSMDLKYSALEWSQIIDIYVDRRMFELFHPSKVSKRDDYWIWNDYLEIASQSSGIDWADCVRKVGKVALRLLKQSRSSFTPSEAEVDPDYLLALIPKMLGRSGDHLYFSGDKYQILLAGRYLSLYWEEAKEELQDDSAGNLVWTAVYNSACSFLKENEVEALRQTFANLANVDINHARRSSQQPNTLIAEETVGAPRLREDRSKRINTVDIDNFEIAKRRIENLIENAGIDPNLAIPELARFSFDLFSSGNLSFKAEYAAERLDARIWDSVRPRVVVNNLSDEAKSRSVRSELFVEDRTGITFLHPSNEAFLAGYHTAHRWPEVRRELVAISPTNPLFAPVRSVALALAEKGRVPELEVCFKKMVDLEWDEDQERRFDQLIERKALKSITKEESMDLKVLTEERRRKNNPLSASEYEADLRRERAFERVMKSLEDYAETLKS